MINSNATLKIISVNISIREIARFDFKGTYAKSEFQTQRWKIRIKATI